MQRHCHEGRGKNSVRLSPGVEALECRNLLSLLVPVASPAPDTGTATLPSPIGATEVLKGHKVVAVHVHFLVPVNLPTTGDLEQFGLVIAGSNRHGNVSAPVTVPLASATYNPAKLTVTLKPTAPAPVRQYWVVTQTSLSGSAVPGSQATWTTLVKSPNDHPGNGGGGSFPWADFNPLVWPAMLVMR